MDGNRFNTEPLVCISVSQAVGLLTHNTGIFVRKFPRREHFFPSRVHKQFGRLLGCSPFCSALSCVCCTRQLEIASKILRGLVGNREKGPLRLTMHRQKDTK